jgi:formate hydrogenlyase subunit 3/multisubunit Na+/H+ antiporter MnhD subunit/pimeloyl-ACP methyl ester carboxylesterase
MHQIPMSDSAFSSLILGGSLIVPVAMLFACLSPTLLKRMLSLLWIAPVPALVASMVVKSSPPIVLDLAPYRVALELDAPAAMLLGAAALLWLLAGVYASRYLVGNPHIGRFVVCWLLTLTGNIGVFITADLASFYLAFALVSIPAYCFVIHDGTSSAQRAGAVYTALTLLGEALLLFAFVLLAAAGRSLLVSDCMAALPASPWRDATLILLIAGFGLKAYSNVSQMGLIVAVLGMGLTSDRGAQLAAAFYAAHHVLAKGALFLVIGVVATTGSVRLWRDLLPAAVLALGLAGLPLTGGALAKLAVKEAVGEGLVGLLFTFAAAGSTLLMLQFLRRLRTAPVRDASERATTGLAMSWLVTALAAVLVPSAVYFVVPIGNLSGILSPAELWTALWPILVGGLLWLGLQRWAKFLPDVPEGDIVVVAEAGARASVTCGAAFEQTDTFLRRWPVACLSLLILAIILGALMLGGCSTTGKDEQLPSIVRAERQLQKAERTRSDLPQKTAELLSVARTVAVRIPEDSGETEREAAINIYDRAAADLATELPELAQLAADRGSGESIIVQNKRTGEVYRLRPGRTSHGDFSWTFFQKLLDARTLRVRREEKAAIIPGLGGTLVGVRRSVPPGSPPPRLEPTYGYRVPVTSILDFSSTHAGDSAPVEVRLQLVDPRQSDTARIGGRRFPLAANFSAPFLSYSRLNELWLGFINMIRGGNMRNTFGLVLTEPYDPDRIPVIFVHGLLSSGYIWRRTALTLVQDPEIRRHYEFWVFSYPTGNPIFLSALRLREDLAFAKERFGLQQGAVLIGHSMGGLLCRMQVTNSGRTIWDGVFGPRAEKLYSQVPDDSRAKRALIFQANPAVRRVIFVATPHRGSRLAEGGIAAIAIWLIRLPFDLLYEVPEHIAYALNPQSGGRTLPTSIQGLSPNSPLLHALDRLPIEVPHHSIIGDRGRGDTPNSSDGVVPYWSSHLTSAQSEMIAPTGHEPMTDPRAVEEIRRILLLNLGIGEDRLSAPSAKIRSMN